MHIHPLKEGNGLDGKKEWMDRGNYEKNICVSVQTVLAPLPLDFWKHGNSYPYGFNLVF